MLEMFQPHGIMGCTTIWTQHVFVMSLVSKQTWNDSSDVCLFCSVVDLSFTLFSQVTFGSKWVFAPPNLRFPPFAYVGFWCRRQKSSTSQLWLRLGSPFFSNNSVITLQVVCDNSSKLLQHARPCCNSLEGLASSTPCSNCGAGWLIRWFWWRPSSFLSSQCRPVLSSLCQGRTFHCPLLWTTGSSNGHRSYPWLSKALLNIQTGSMRSTIRTFTKKWLHFGRRYVTFPKHLPNFAATARRYSCCSCCTWYRGPRYRPYCRHRALCITRHCHTCWSLDINLTEYKWQSTYGWHACGSCWICFLYKLPLWPCDRCRSFDVFEWKWNVEDVAKDRHDGCEIQHGTAWDSPHAVSKKNERVFAFWIQQCCHFPHVHMLFFLFRVFMFSFSNLFRFVTWKDDFYTWRRSV